MTINKLMAWLIIVVVGVFAYGEVKVRLDEAKYFREVQQYEVDSIWNAEGYVNTYDNWGRLTN